MIDWSFLAKNIDKNFQNYDFFSSKVAQNTISCFTLFKFAENRELEIADIISLYTEKRLVETRRPIKVF